jgi:peptide/nickel transport system substrate-binding protein
MVMRGFKKSMLLLTVVMLTGLWAMSPALAEDKPHYGGVLRVALAGDPPSLDMHQEQTFMVTIPMSTVYNTLVMFDPHQYPKINGDLAQAWTVSEDGMTWTFTLHQGVKFHDGSELTSADVKASWDKIVFPPEGVVSVRKSLYQMVKSIEAPERYTVVFRLHYPAASFLSMLAHPANFIYAKKYLDQDINWYKTHAIGTGPFKLQEYVRGAALEFKRNPDYWKKGLPYLDGAKYFIIPDTGARAKSIRAERTDVEFRGFAPVEVESITAQMGDKVTAAHSGQPAHWGIAINVDKKPFDDARVRQALSLALDRYEMVKTLGPLTGLDSIAGPMPPGTPWTLSPEELQALPGFGKDHEANLREAKRLLAEAGYPNGFQTVLTNRAVKLPYIDFGVYVVSAWKKIGVEAEHKLEESATWSKSRVTRDFELLVDPFGFAAEGDPDEVMVKFTSSSPSNWGRFKDPVVDQLFERQKVEREARKRAQLVHDMQKRVMDQAWEIVGLWWTRVEVRSARIHNYEPLPSHWMNRRLEDVWLSTK